MFASRLPLFARAGIVSSFVAILFGYDTGSIGPVTTMSSFVSTFGSFSATVHGVVVSSVLIPGAIAALFAGALAHRFGHAKLIALGSMLYGIGAAIECSTSNLGGFTCGRLVKGLGLGLSFSNVFVQVSETSPVRVRGIMTALPVFINSLGIVIGYFVCYGTARVESSASWRVPTATGSALGFVLSSSYWFTPPSPRWLLSRGRRDEAYDVSQRLGFNPKEQEEIFSSIAMDPEQTHGTIATQALRAVRRTLANFSEAFSSPYRSRTAFGCFLMAMQQFSGIDGVLYYAPTLFTQAGLDGEQATFLASGVSALVILVATVIATLCADYYSRRISTIVGGLLIALLMLVIGSMYAANEVHADSGAGKWVVIVSIYFFAIVFNATWAVCIRVFLVESLPQKTRSSASSLAQSCNWSANYVVALITPILISKTSYGAYYLFAGCSLLCASVAAIYMPETKGRSLEAIEQGYLEKSGAVIATQLV